MLDYTDREACRAFLAAQLVATGALAALPDDAETLLAASAGVTASGVAIYRPYLVAARLLDRRLHDDVLLSASGATFRAYADTVRGWLTLQASLDAAFGLTVPDGFGASPPAAHLRSGSTRREVVW